MQGRERFNKRESKDKTLLFLERVPVDFTTLRDAMLLLPHQNCVSALEVTSCRRNSVMWRENRFTVEMKLKCTTALQSKRVWVYSIAKDEQLTRINRLNVEAETGVYEGVSGLKWWRAKRSEWWGAWGSSGSKTSGSNLQTLLVI